jgi:hypothetical protein
MGNAAQDLLDPWAFACRSGRSPDWLKFKNSGAPAVQREAEEDWR